MKNFFQVLINTLVAAATINLVWFALTYFLYLETQTVVATGIIGGIFLVALAASSFWVGSIVDHNKKKTAMLISSFASLVLFVIALIIFITAPEDGFKSLASIRVWAFVVVILAGAVVGNIRNISLPVAVTLLVPEDRRDKANGMIGMVMGVSFALASIGSGLLLGFAGMLWVLIVGVVVTLLSIIHLLFISIPENEIVHTDAAPKAVDIKGTVQVVRAIPGLIALIFFTTFNNFLGGVFIALMDAYGLSLVSVKVWGTLWGILSLGIIVGGLYISKRGLGANPLRTLFRVSIINWIVAFFFTIQPSIVLLAVGMLIWMSLFPFIEAIEHTIVQKVVPYERQGRVIGFAQSIEQAASPLTAFLIGPIAQFVFIPFMTTGKGVDLIGDWFGVGPGRGIALVFMLTSTIGLIVTLIAMRSRPYKLLAAKYMESEQVKNE